MISERYLTCNDWQQTRACCTVPIQMHFQGGQSPPHGLKYSALQINDLIKDNELCAFSYPQINGEQKVMLIK